jgi:hypothetical protein
MHGVKWWAVVIRLWMGEDATLITLWDGPCLLGSLQDIHGLDMG